jgi:hypothetical protein
MYRSWAIEDARHLRAIIQESDLMWPPFGLFFVNFICELSLINETRHIFWLCF